MHKIEIPQYMLDRIMKRRGRMTIYDRIDAGRTALLVVDMQNFFIAEGQGAEIPVNREITPIINRLAEALRAAGGTVVWVTSTWNDETRRSWSVFFEDFVGPEARESMVDAMREGCYSHELWSELEPRDGDWHVVKNRFSAFIQGASDIEARLRAADIDTLIVTGTVTNVCCESTARDAMMRNFKVITVSDANGARNDDEHNASLAALYQVFSDVQTADEVIQHLVPVAAAATDATNAAE
jgi:ureidoacrylate peracid hydrolase